LLSEHDMALKEWAVAVMALASGQTICAVRKGGIHEKRFDVPSRACFLFPTYLHQSEETIQPRYRAALEQVLQHQPIDGKLHLRYFAEITDVVPIDAPTRLDGLAPHVIWTPAYVEQRFRWRPRQPLQLLLLRIYRLLNEVTLDLVPSYNGCSSWVTLERPVATAGAVAALGDARYEVERSAVLAAVQRVAVS